ncbi:MAG TPA: hypothetical protein VE173_16315 [Longimicrobiales bacterium]|nr:hypothetical protein [Longimicrobiales bacterium]
MELALVYLTGQGVEVEVTDDGLASGDGRVFGLEPLRRRLALLPSRQWSEAVASHFTVLLGTDPEMPASFGQAAPNLRSAVVAEADLGWFDNALMERSLVDGLGERLMLRRGAVGMTVTAETVAGWEADPDMVWERARDGSLWDEPVERQLIRHGGGAHIVAVRGGRWTSTRVLAVERYIDPRLPYGALVAVPARDEILIHQIRDESFTEAALSMLSQAAASYVESPLPVGCDLFWWSEGRLHRICRPGDQHYEYIKVPEFSAMLWRLEEAVSPDRKTG